jgi:hypothetical protein
MNLPPRKKGPQLWTDVALPGMETLEVKSRELSRKEEDDAEHKIKYRKYRGARSIVCHDCAYEGASTIQAATYIRIYQGFERYLCNAHATHRRDFTDKKERKA